MSLERNLPENVRRRVLQQWQDAEKQRQRYDTALEFARKAHAELAIGPMPMSAVDPATVHELSIVIKCIEADRDHALRLETSAFRIYCEHEGINPDEDREAGPDPIRDGWVGKDGRP